MTTSSAPKVLQADRCGICDSAECVWICSWCFEPMCLAHVRVHSDGDGKEYICAACAIDGPAARDAARPGATP